MKELNIIKKLKTITKFNIIKSLRSRKINNTQLTFKQILAREKKLSIIPSYVLPISVGFACFCFFVFYEYEKAIFSSLFASLFIPLFTISLYVKQAKLTDRNPTTGDYFFKTKGYEKTVIRFERLAKLLVSYSIVFLISSILLGLLFYANSLVEEKSQYYDKVVGAYTIWLFLIPLMMVYTMLLFRFRLRQFDDFEFHYSLGCFKIAQNLPDLSEEKYLSYFMKGITHYDYFLKNNLRLRIDKNSQLFSKILISDKNDRTHILEEIISQMKEQTKFDVITCFVKLVSDDEKDSFFTPYSITDKLKYWTPAIVIFGTTIGILSQIIPLFIVQGN